MGIRTMQVLCSAALLAAAGAHAQGGAAPIKPGLWETTMTSTMQIALPPELQARIDAMTPQQQAMMKANMPGGAGAPVTTTTHSCAASQTSMNDLINQAQEKNGTKCTLANQTQTATGVSFDISCTTPQGTANGHSSFTMADSNHVSGTMHMTAQMNGRGGTSSMAMDSTLTSKYLGADCGDVKPNTAVVVTK